MDLPWIEIGMHIAPKDNTMELRFHTRCARADPLAPLCRASGTPARIRAPHREPGGRPARLTDEESARPAGAKHETTPGAMREPKFPTPQTTTLWDLVEAIQEFAETDQEVVAVLCHMLQERKILWLVSRTGTTEIA